MCAAQTYRMPLAIEVPASILGVLEHNRDRMRALVVGGSVRDAILGIRPKDIDIEVYGVGFDDLAEMLRPHGKTDLVGRAFGVVKFRDGEGREVDLSVPRRESTNGPGHRDFGLSFDPKISPREAAARRDFTINALAWDPFTEEVHDYFGGVEDLRKGILRATSAAFSEDALRVLRGMQFSARFNLNVERNTAHMCVSLTENYKHLATERIAEEWMKLAEKGNSPGRVWGYLVETGWIRLFPLLNDLVGVPQDPEWHPEGTVDIHTGHVMDAAARIAVRENITADHRAVLVLAALTHDLAKSYVSSGGTTMLREKAGEMKWTAYGHEAAGGPMARAFLASIGIKADIIRRVVPLVENHLIHSRFPADTVAGKIFVRRLADRLAPATIKELVLLIEADQSGRPPLPVGTPGEAQRLLKLAEQEDIADRPPPKLIQGKDVLSYYRGKAGPHIGEAVSAAYQAYLDGKFADRKEGLSWLEDYLEKRIRLIGGKEVLEVLGEPGPDVGRAINAAWAAQRAGSFSTTEEARAWLKRYFESK